MKKTWIVFIVVVMVIAMAYDVVTIPVFLVGVLVIGILYIVMKNRRSIKRQLFTYAVVDTETTGLNPVKHEIVSVSAIKFAVYIDIEESSVKIEQYEDTFDRYYYAKRYYDDAISINGLDSEKISSKRWNADYPPYFKKDYRAFLEFIDGCDFIVGHNIKFDLSFLPKVKCGTYCTMGGKKDQSRIPR